LSFEATHAFRCILPAEPTAAMNRLTEDLDGDKVPGTSWTALRSSSRNRRIADRASQLAPAGLPATQRVRILYDHVVKNGVRSFAAAQKAESRVRRAES